jgi:hypothetical protein
MATGITFDSTAFRAEFRARVLRSKRTMAEVTNETAFQACKAAQKRTPKADLASIEALGITYRTTTKTGKQLKRRKGIYAPTTAFKLIALKEMWTRGPSPRSFANAAALDTAIARKLSRRASSRGFVASWVVPAMRALIRHIHGGASLSGDQAKRFKGTKGSAKPANDSSWNPFAEIESSTGLNGPHQSAASQDRVYNHLERAWNQGLNDVTEEMGQYAETQLQKTLDGN